VSHSTVATSSKLTTHLLCNLRLPGMALQTIG
jgi:hypothetical protein